VSFPQRAKHFEELKGSTTAVNIDPKHFTENGNADLKADTSKKTEENSLREKIRKEAKPKQARKEKEDAGQERHQAC
jgi:hypothetical protein